MASDQTPARSKILQRIHESSKRYLEGWIGVPAHVHHVAHRMANPPLERPQSRREFQHLLRCLEIPDEDARLFEKFGYAVKSDRHGDRLIVAWEAHTEYYSYQIWHIPHDTSKPPDFGPITFPGYVFPFCPLGMRVNALDILILIQADPPYEELRDRLPGRNVYGSRVFDGEFSVITTFTPDKDLRERYLITSPAAETLLKQLPRLIEAVVAIENYYHLIHLPFQAFARAVDQVHEYEQRHLHQRTLMTRQLAASTSQTLQKWVDVLTEDFLQVSRLAESMRYMLAGAVPYDSIVRANLAALRETPLPLLRPLSDYVLWRITGVADGYQQLLRRIDALENDFSGTISVIRTRIDLLLQEQNLALQDQNLSLLASVDKTTRSQAILQQTVEGLSVIVITYYLAGLGHYVFKAFEELGWIANATLATAVFVPVALAVSFGLILFGRRLIRSVTPRSTSD